MHVEVRRAPERRDQRVTARRRRGAGQPGLADQVPRDRPIDNPEHPRHYLRPRRLVPSARDDYRRPIRLSRGAVRRGIRYYSLAWLVCRFGRRAKEVWQERALLASLAPRRSSRS